LLLVAAMTVVVLLGAAAAVAGGRSRGPSLGDCEAAGPVDADAGPEAVGDEDDEVGVEDGPDDTGDGRAFCLVLDNPGPIRDLEVAVVSTNEVDPLDVDNVVLYHPGGPGGSPRDHLLAGGLPLNSSSAAFIAVDGASSAINRGFCGEADREYFTGLSDQGADTMAAVRQECTGHLDAQGGSSIQDADDWVRVLDALDIDRADVLSHSYGTLVAEAFVRRHPNRVERVVADAVLASDVDAAIRVAAVRDSVNATVPLLLAGCPDEPECPDSTRTFLEDHTSYDAVREALLDIGAGIGVGEEPLTPVMVDHATMAALRGREYWSAFYQGIADMVERRDAAVLFTLGEREGIGVDRKVHFVSLCSSITPPARMETYTPSGSNPFDSWLADYSICSITVHPPLLEMITGQEPSATAAGTAPPAWLAVDGEEIDAVVFGSATDPFAPIELARNSGLWRQVPLCETAVVGHTAYSDPDLRSLMGGFLDGSLDAGQVVDRCVELRTTGG